VNQGELSQCFKHDDSTIKIVLALLLLLLLPTCKRPLGECNVVCVCLTGSSSMDVSGYRSAVAAGCPLLLWLPVQAVLEETQGQNLP